MTPIELIQLLRKHLALVVLLPLAFGGAMAVFSLLFVRNVYTAITSMYVLYNGLDGGSSADNSTLAASQMIANDVARLFSSERVCSDVLDELGMESLVDYTIDVQSESNTRVIYLSVTGPDAERAAAIANAMAKGVSDVAQEVMSVEAVNVLDQAKVPDQPSGHKRLIYRKSGAGDCQ